MRAPWRIFFIGCLAATLAAAAWGPRTPAAQAQGACAELIRNGGFETDAAWVLGNDPVPPQYVTYAYHTPNRSLAMGIVQGANQKSYSSVRQQVTIPPTANQARLLFWFYPKFTASAPKTDWIQLFLLFPDGTKAPLWDSFNTSQMWNQMQFDLSPYRGRTFTVYFNTYNDGLGGSAGMFIDDVSLLSCSNGTSTNTATATPPIPAPTRTPTRGLPVCVPYCITPPPRPSVARPTWTPVVIIPTVSPHPITPWPGNCIDVVKNGSFSYGFSGWYRSKDLLPVHLVSSPALSPPSALQLGTQSQQIRSYSSVRQYVTIPAGTRATLQFWTWNWSEPSAGADRQEAILLASNNTVLAVLWRVLGNEQAWRQVAVDLTPYNGRAVAIYFNTYNDGAGGRTAMFLDNVQLLACGRNRPPPGPVTSLPPATLGTPEALPELPPLVSGDPLSPPEPADMTAGAPAAPELTPLVTDESLGALEPADMTARASPALELTPLMTRVVVEGGPLPTLTLRPTPTATPSPALVPTPQPAALQRMWNSFTEQTSTLACFVGLLILVFVAFLFMWFVWPGLHGMG